MARPRVKLEKLDRFSRPPLERMMKLHNHLNARRFPNCRKLAEELEVSTKTIQRDIDFMRDRLGLPIGYDQLQFGFYYTEPVTNFPSIEVSEGEVVALFVAQKALEQYRGNLLREIAEGRVSEDRRRTEGHDRIPLGRCGLGDFIQRHRHERGGPRSI